MTFYSLISCPRSELLIASAQDCQRLFFTIGTVLFAFTSRPWLFSSIPCVEVRHCWRGGSPFWSRSSCGRKEGRDVTGSKKNINLTFSERVNWFIALQQCGFCILSSYVFLFLMIWPGCGFDCAKQHACEMRHLFKISSYSHLTHKVPKASVMI